MDLPAGYGFRAPTLDDLSGVVDLPARAGMRVVDRWDVWERSGKVEA